MNLTCCLLLMSFSHLEHASEVHAHFVRLFLRAVLYISGFSHPSHRQWISAGNEGCSHSCDVALKRGGGVFPLARPVLDRIWEEVVLAWFRSNPGVVQSQWRHTWNKQTPSDPLEVRSLAGIAKKIWHLCFIFCKRDDITLPAASWWRLLGFFAQSCPAMLVPPKYVWET